MQIKPLNDMWVVVSITGHPVLSTLASTEEGSKRLYLPKQDWHYAEGNGYRCVRVDISFNVKE